MTLYERGPETLRIGWPSIIGYVRAGACSVLNLFGLRFVRVGGLSALSIG